ncbi:MAG TPA: tRNA pseudouridine(38-40) synthase TruA [Bacteroidota bacterium]|nr:tRNA pseudouridine(38-40) synthase TruA [Bacteroidota bacterium]
MRNIKLLIEYEGTKYAGWQRQENDRTIQGEIEAALHQILQEEINLIGAGRTDAGVHARGQIGNFRTESKLQIEEIKGGLNALLPEDIVILRVEEVPLEFHARYSAKERKYSYLITKKPTALMRNISWFVKFNLDLELMNRVAALLLGVHDFSSFCKIDSENPDHQCTILTSHWDDGEDLFKYSISANRFLYGMVRALVGTMVDVGRGYTQFDDFFNILLKKDRAKAGMSAPAQGLVLEKIYY